jgi:hypothetical protein
MRWHLHPEGPLTPLGSAAQGARVIWDGIAFETPVIPAKAGIQSVDSTFPKVCDVAPERARALASRFEVRA